MQYLSYLFTHLSQSDCNQTNKFIESLEKNFLVTCTNALNLFQQKHPHVIFEARTKANKGCANSGNMFLSRRQKHISGLVLDEEQLHPNGGGRYKRDVREKTKYIETAIIVDKAMFEKRNGSTRAEVVHDAIQVANIADLVSCFISL